jgi:hypothetical protein
MLIQVRLCGIADAASENLRRPWARAYLAAVGQIDRRIKDHLVAPLDAAVDFNLLSKVAYHRDLAQVNHAVLHHGDLQSGFVQNDRIRGHLEAWSLARNVELDGAVDPGAESSVGIRDIDFRQ